MISLTSKGKKEGKKKVKNMKEKGLTVHAFYKHTNGLPIALNVLCEICSYPDRFEFKAGNMNFNLDKSKINDICTKADTDIRKQYVSSVGSVVGGAFFWGLSE